MSVQPIDLVQLKWQQIRVVEASHVTERENIEMRKKMKDIQAKSSRIGGEALKKFMSNFKAYTIKQKLEMGKLKMHFVKDINDCLHMQAMFKAAFDKSVALLEEKEVAILTGKAENRLQRTQLSAAKHDAQEIAKIHEQEKAKLQAKIDKLLADRLDSQYSSEKIISEAAQKQKMYDDLLVAKTKLEASNEHLKEENKRLKGVIATLQEEYSNSMQGMQSLLDKHKAESDENIGGLCQEIDYLRNIIAEQEEQIQRLSNQLIGNKSHFAKFVEIKSENLSLQAKLNAITGKSTGSSRRPKFGSGPVQLPNLGHSNSNNNLVDADAPSSSQQSMGPVPNPAHMLPAYQKMKSKLVIANSIMKVMGDEGSGPPDTSPALDDAVAILNVVSKTSSKTNKNNVPTLPVGATASSGAGYDEAEYIVNNRSPRGNALSSESYAGGSNSRKIGSSSSRGVNIEPHLMINFKPPQQSSASQVPTQPHPPLVDNDGPSGRLNATNNGGGAAGVIRKSMRVDHNLTSSSPVPQVNFTPDFNPPTMALGQTANSNAVRVPGVQPQLKSRERVVI